MEKRLLINFSGRYVDPNMITFARQKQGTGGDNAQIEIFVQGAPETITVGKEYWDTLCGNHFRVVDN